MISTTRRLVLQTKFAAQNVSRMMTSISAESYTEKQNKTGRPVSPHVQIYKFPVTALTSITHRVTGSVMAGGITGIGGLALVGVDVPALMQFIGNYPLIGGMAKFSVAFPFVYHYICGTRHLFWDANPKMLETEEVTKSSTMIFIAAGAISSGIAML